MLKQIDARAAHLEKVDAEVREWEKKTAKSAEAELKSRAAQIANELCDRTREKISAWRKCRMRTENCFKQSWTHSNQI